MKKSLDTGSMSGVWDLEVMLHSKFGIEKKLKQIISDSGLSKSGVSYGANWAYIDPDNAFNLREALPEIGLLSLIMLSGYLIIYNIFYISVVKDIRFYGLLKSIGMTSRQLRRLIFRQAVMLSVTGIPFGLILGYFARCFLTPYIMNDTTATNTVTSSSPVIFIAASLFSLLTVFISCFKPAKIASLVSPIEAIRYTGIMRLDRKNVKHTTFGKRLERMAFSNVFRIKSRVFIVISSLSLSIILLNCTYTVVTGFDIKKYIKNYAGTDFTIGDASYYRYSFDARKPNSVTEPLCNELSKLAGVKRIEKMYFTQIDMPITDWMRIRLQKRIPKVEKMFRDYFRYVLKRKRVTVSTYGVDKGIYELLKPYVQAGKIDMKLLSTGKYAIVKRNSYCGADIYRVGEKVSLTDYRGKTKKFTVLALVDSLPLYLYSQFLPEAGIDVYIPSMNFKQLYKNPSIMTALFNVKHRYISYVERYIKNKIKMNPTLDYRSRRSFEKEYDDMVKNYTSVGYTLSFILALIGILNFANVIMTSILNRRNEFATIQSIGMTTAMLKRMIFYEGGVYATLTILVALIAGIPINYFGVNAFVEYTGVFTYRLTVVPTIFCAPFLALITAAIPVICLNKMNSSSIVERLREVE